MSSDPRRQLPAVDRLARKLAQERPESPSWAATEAAREAIATARDRLAQGTHADPTLLGLEALERLGVPHLRPVVNATGVVLHTNLGRAVLAPGAGAAAAAVASHYASVELDLAAGGRGDRLLGVSTLLRVLSGAPAAMAVNNNAAAVLLALATCARGREVVVSRGELVEIGGSFRVPEILEQAGVRLVEVGTTNRTHARDYEAAIGPDTGALLKVHRSNFEQRGFVAEVDLRSLVEIGHRHDVPVIEDLGSGTLVDLRGEGLPEESFAPARLASGVDLVCFSGDKLLGGPQAGLVLGTESRIAELRRNPLARALRMGKLSLAALDWTLRALVEERFDELPSLRMLRQRSADLLPVAQRLAKRLAGVAPADLAFEVVPSRSPVGGGSLPGFALDSYAVAVSSGRGAQALAGALRGHETPVLSRIDADRVHVDVRTLLPGDEDTLAEAFGQLERVA